MNWNEGLQKGWNEFINFLRLDWDDDDDGGLKNEIEVIRFVPIEKPSLARVLIEQALGLMRVEVKQKR